MVRLRSHTTLESLQAQAIALDNKIKKVAAKERARRESEQNRRVWLGGQAALALMEADPQSEFAKILLAAISDRARSVTDRALFNFVQEGPPEPTNGQPADDTSLTSGRP